MCVCETYSQNDTGDRVILALWDNNLVVVRQRIVHEDGLVLQGIVGNVDCPLTAADLGVADVRGVHVRCGHQWEVCGVLVRV